VFLVLFSISSAAFAGASIEVKDALGHKFVSPEKVEKVICSGSGCLRLLTYLQGQRMISGVEDIEKRSTSIDPRPYFFANPFFKDLPLIGEFRGRTRPELVVSLETLPQVIFKTYPEAGTPAVKLQEATGIPVIPLQYGNLFNKKEDLYSSIRTMGAVIGKTERAEEVVSFMEETIKDLAARTKDLDTASRKTAYVGGIAYRGPHGICSTEEGYPPFAFTGTRNVAFAGEDLKASASHADVSREKILEWNPEVIFIDLSTLNAPKEASALEDLRNDSLWQGLKAVKSGEVYGVLPYNWYTQNFGNILADSYFVGKVLYPERFKDVDPAVKAGEIFSFLVGEDVFDKMDGIFDNLVFRKLELH
jgi:iron complex transport system substrate-binding protein